MFLDLGAHVRAVSVSAFESC